jgi:hypothetical protein
MASKQHTRQSDELLQKPAESGTSEVQHEHVMKKIMAGEACFRKTVALLPMILVEYDSDRLVTYVNKIGYEILGYDLAAPLFRSTT